MIRHTMKAVLLSSVALGLVAPAFAQIEEIVVSARKRTESLQNVPLSISAFSSEAIEKAGIADFDDVARLTPSLVFDTHFGAQDTRPTIRGLPATRGRPPVGILLNGVDISSEAVSTAGGGNLLNLPLLDLERIEVVKGPQSALYGRVAFGGAVNYITKAPGDEFEGKVNATIATDGVYEIGGAIGGPLAEDVFAARVHAAYSEGDGYYTNAVSGDTIGGYENTQASFAARFTPNDRFTADLNLIYSDSEQEQPAYYQYSLIDGSAGPVPLPANVAGQTFGNLTLRDSISSVPVGPLRARDTVQVSVNPRTLSDYPGSYVETFFADLRMSLDLGNATLTSTTGYLNADSGVFQDIDGYGEAPVDVALPAPGGVGEPLPFLFEFRVDTETVQYSQNLQLADLESDGFRWAIGTLYWFEEVNQDNRTFANLMFVPTSSAGLNTVLAGNPAFVSRDDGRETEHWSIYGLIEFDVTPQFTLGMEARYSWEDYIYDFSTSQIALGPGSDPLPTRQGAPAQRGVPFDEATFAPKFFAEYVVNDDVLLYASAAKGVKPGGISTVGVFNSVGDNGYDAETLWNYELGVKSVWADGRVLFNISAFYMDYTDKQVSTLVVDPSQSSGFRGVTTNAGGAEVLGLELDAQFQITDKFLVTAAYTFLDTEYTDFTLLTRTQHNIAYGGNCTITEVGTGSQSTQCAVDLTGNELERAPNHAFSATASYTQPIRDGLDLVGEVAVQYQGERFFEDLNAHTFESYTLVDLRLSLEAENWSITAFVDNLFDDDTVKSGFTQGDFSGLFSSPGSRSFVLNAPEPARGGVRVNYRF